MTTDPLACGRTWHPTMPNVQDLTADRDRWRTLATRLLWDTARRTTLEAVCVRYGIDVGDVRAEPGAGRTETAREATILPLPPRYTPETIPAAQEAK